MNKDMSKIKIFVTGGGTGGHIYPAVSVIYELLKRDIKRENIFYVGNKKNLERKIALDNDFQFLSTGVFGMPRKISFKFLYWLLCLFISILKALYYCFKYKPDIVFGTGGYVSAPVLFSAKILNIPYVLHDSDCAPGVVTRKFATWAKGVNLAFVEAKKCIKSNKIVHYNNPVRSAFFEKTKNEARSILGIKDEFLILIMGGSQGAKTINEGAVEFIKKNSDNKNIRIILQTGRKNYEQVVSMLNIPSNTRIEPYFDDMSIPILASDLIVSRAGSISISEILSSKTPSILVLYPYAASDHQRVNARAISDKNGAVYLEDADLKTGALTLIIEDLLKNKEKYEKLKQNVEKLGENLEKSTENITDLILSCI